MSKQELLINKEQLQEAESLRRTAFAATTLSVIACVLSVVLIPMLYSYMQYVQIKLEDELDFCSRCHFQSQVAPFGEEWILLRNENDLEKPMDRFKRENFSAIPERLKQAIYVGQHDPNEVRPKRQAYQQSSASYQASSSQPSPPGVQPMSVEQVHGSSAQAESCCSCGVGKPGPNGPPGGDGKDGKDGLPGPDGDSGVDAPPAKKVTAEDFCFDCPAGPAGPPGPKGTPGNDGSHGIHGSPGNPGPAGPLGQPGTPGQPGQPGQKGESGQPGQMVEVPGIAGPVGPPGQTGRPGQDGKNGLAGRPGTPGAVMTNGRPGLIGPNGQPGGNGNKGPDGLAGTLGGCDHCPPPRTAPGF
uniref:Nematode cuticle collagen N-terminal domain-containing protein n=1 Tax=Ditylenchus dipsaci TaxID=166011 RepID=A0A915E659_9BILA